MKVFIPIFLLVSAFGIEAGENNASTTATPDSTIASVETSTPSNEPSLQSDAVSNDAPSIMIPATEEPPLGLHGITEQQLNLRYYNFICSSHFQLDCKITESLQICMKDNYVAVLGLPLSFEKESKELKILEKWMKQCDLNDQNMNKEAMRLIRQRIRIQNERNWDHIFKSSSQFSRFVSGFVALSVVMFLQ